MRRLVVVARAVAALAAAALVAAPGAAAAGQPQLSPLARCGDAPGFRCGTLLVPIDRTGTTPGRVRLRVAVQDGYVRGRRLTVALSGGPGQPGVPFASQFAAALAPLVDAGERLVVLDQRGTGRHALRCPELQRLRALDPFRPEAVAACADRLGPLRRHLATADTVDDLEALRAALGAPRLGLFGVSYGTHVALEYARTHPRRTRQLVLDSVLGPRGWNGFLLDTIGAVPRALREACARGACAATTADPVADLGVVAPRAERDGLRARLPDARGRVRPVRRRLGEELLFALLAGDLNPELGALLPAALAAAARGDDAPLLRLLPIAGGPRIRAEELSTGLLVATDCADARLPYALGAPPDERRARADAALGAVAPERHAPFSAATVRAASLADDCSLWPVETPRAPAAGPLPDVRALLLNGRLDMRTPLENALATAAELPRAAVVAVPGAGHDVLGFDTGCARRALVRFAARRPVGDPCAGRRPLVTPPPVAPRSLAALVPAPGIAGVRGRAVAAALRTADDVLRVAFALQDGGMEPRAGCLRAGRFAVGAGGLRLHGCAYVPGLHLDGLVAADGGGIVRVRGPRGASGALRLTGDGGAAGRIGGRSVRVTRSSRTAAARRAPASPAAPAPRGGDRRAAPWPRPRTPAR